MGEEEIIGFEALKQTYVFWNIDDYPIPRDDLRPIFDNFLKALHIMGFRDGYMDVRLYSEQLSCDKEVEEFEVIHQCESYAAGCFKVPDITVLLVRYASNMGPGPVNFMVIAKPKRELHRVLHCFKSRHHNVLLVEPPPDEEFLLSVDYLLENTRLLGGGKPRFDASYLRYRQQYDMSIEKYIWVEDDVSKTVDFSERIPTVKGARTGVFWDAVDCPFPLGSTPDEIYHSIASALVEREFSDKITIWAYLDDDDKKGHVLLRDKTWASRIYFLPGGDKASRHIRMFNDIFFWLRDSPYMTRSYEISLVLVSDQVKDAPYYTRCLQQLANMHYDLLLVTPTLEINKPESPRWPRYLIDIGGYFFPDESVHISQEPSPTQHEADAAASQEETRSEDEEMLDSTLSTEDLNKPESAEWSTGSESSEEPCPIKYNADVAREETLEQLARLYDWDPITRKYKPKPGCESLGGPGCESFEAMYRWDPITLMYKLKSLSSEEPSPNKHEANAAPIYRWDPIAQMYKLKSLGGPGCESSQEPSPKKHEADAASEGETPEKLATHGSFRLDPITLNMNKLEGAEWPGRQIDGGSGWESSKEPCLKKPKADAAEETP